MKHRQFPFLSCLHHHVCFVWTFASLSFLLCGKVAFVICDSLPTSIPSRGGSNMPSRFVVSFVEFGRWCNKFSYQINSHRSLWMLCCFTDKIIPTIVQDESLMDPVDIANGTRKRKRTIRDRRI